MEPTATTTSHLLSLLDAPLPLISAAARGFPVPDTPPLTPGEATPRTPRKPAHPRPTGSLNSVNRENSAIISFTMVQGVNQMSPSLKITSVAPSKPRGGTTARRRLWVQPGESCELLSVDSTPPLTTTPVTTGERLDENSSPDADDEDGSSPLSCFSPPYSPDGFEETVSETAAKPSSSSYPVTINAKEKRPFQFVSPKPRTAQKSKTCASCKTKKTPLWRDAEDGTPYCNACGIRFKKYRFRCPVCSYIPRKDERETSKLCCQCGARLIHCKVSGRY